MSPRQTVNCVSAVCSYPVADPSPLRITSTPDLLQSENALDNSRELSPGGPGHLSQRPIADEPNSPRASGFW